MNNELFKLFSLVTGPKAYVPPTPPQEYNDATGGTVLEYTNSADGRKYRRHTFTSSGSLAVTKAVNPFVVSLVGGGAGGGGNPDGFGRGPAGGAGGYVRAEQALMAGSLQVTVGSGGGPGYADIIGGGNGSNGGNGGATSVTGCSVVAGGGQAGQAFNSGPPPTAPAGTPAPAANGGVTPIDYTTTGLPTTTGTGGMGGQYANGGPNAGIAGAVVIEYEIAAGPPPPTFNDATGGTITEYTKDGIRYRVHTFETGGTFEVTASVSPFRYLASGGGGGGGGSNNAVHGGAGGGGKVTQGNELFPVGPITVTVGTGGAGGGGNGGGNNGGQSALGALTAAGGTGCWANAGGTVGAGGGANVTSDIDGTSKPYGTDALPWDYGGYGAPGAGRGGGGGAAEVGTNSGGTGTGGTVIIAYQIAS